MCLLWRYVPKFMESKELDLLELEIYGCESSDVGGKNQNLTR